MHEVYQYRVVAISPINVNPTLLERSLNELGLDGWYVLSAQPDYILMERIQEIVEVQGEHTTGIISADLGTGL